MSEIDPTIFDQPVSYLGLSVRARKCLQSAGIETVGALSEKKPDDLLALRNFGANTLGEVQHRLSLVGLELGKMLPLPDHLQPTWKSLLPAIAAGISSHPSTRQYQTAARQLYRMAEVLDHHHQNETHGMEEKIVARAVLEMLAEPLVIE